MSKFRLVLAATIALAISAFASGFVAQAAEAPSVTVANSGLTLTGSTVANFDPTATLRLNLSASTGEITVTLGSSGATVASDSALKGATVSIVGTQDQLNAALATTSISQNCSTSRTITASVTPGTDFTVINPANGHLYSLVTSSSSSYADARAAAKLKTIPGTTGFGYLTNITSEAENTFINTYFTGSPYIGGSDSVTEGDWYWMDGPEAGTKFFSAGAAVGNAFVKWAPNEPNNSGSQEHYAQLWGNDTWNDISGSSTALVEFGGMPGDDFSSFVGTTAASTATLTTPVLLAGAGTSASPYLVTNAADFAVVPACSGAGVHFKQTADIVTGVTFTGNSSFVGHYDGDGKKFDLSAAIEQTSSIFGTISGVSSPADTSVSDLDIIGADSSQSFQCQASVLATSVSFATIDGVKISGAKISADCEAGLLANDVSNSVIKNTEVSGEISAMMMVMGVGALASSATQSEFSNNICSLSLTSSEQMPFFDMVRSLGGCVGRSSNSTYNNVRSSGSFLLDEEDMNVMDMRRVGGLIGESYMDTITNSSSSVAISTMRGREVGGLIGMSNLSTISRSFATGAVSDIGGYGIGGLIGRAAASTISNVYATGAVLGDYMVGGLIGDMQAGSTVSKAYATGLVTVTDATTSRGLIGYTDGTNVVDSYWKILSGGVASTVESFGQEVPKFPGELKRISTFANWNISATPSSANDWAICPGANGGYPYLAWQTFDNGCSRSFTTGGTATLTGLAYVGSSMSAAVSGWDPLADLTYQWFEGSTAIAGASTAYFKVTAAQKGKKLSVQVTGSKDGYVSTEASSAQVLVAGAPKATVAVIGGFAAKSSKATSATKAAIAKAIKGIGTVISVKCEGYATGKKLTAAQKSLATARANAVCAAVKATFKFSTTRSLTSLFKKTDKLAEGVRVTFTAVK